jgi:hypothetical protein
MREEPQKNACAAMNLIGVAAYENEKLSRELSGRKERI